MAKKKTTEEFIEDAKKVHGEFADNYDKVKYVNNKTKVIITCPIHGDYEMSPNCYLSGQRCPECGREKAIKKNTMDKEELIKRLSEVHGDKYDYSMINYVNALTKVDVICKEHGVFSMTPAHLLEGHGCKECAKEARRSKLTMGKENFVGKASNRHDDKYDYEKTQYVNNKTEIIITCPIHGDFTQRPDDHLAGKGCPSCAHTLSKAENEICEYVCSLVGSDNVIHGDTNILDGLEIDILIPSYNFGIEYNGLRWHSEEFGKGRNYHLDKTEKACKKGITLIQIFEDEWLEHRELVLEKIEHFLHKSKNNVIGARKCNIKEVSKLIAEPFLEKHHIQGFAGSSVYLGAFYEDKLIGIMSFLEEKEKMWNLTRFSTDIHYSFPGLANKMFKHFINNYSIREVKTFLDRRWSHGSPNVYDRMGFELVEILRPEYRYVVGNKRMHKFGFRKQKLNKQYGLPLTMTESEMTQELGFYKIWDCGLLKYVWKNN